MWGVQATGHEEWVVGPVVQGGPVELERLRAEPE